MRESSYDEVLSAPLFFIHQTVLIANALSSD